MDYFPARDTDKDIEDLRQDITALALKHNDLVVSLSLLWSETQRTSSDPLTRGFCSRQLGNMEQLLHEIGVDDITAREMSLPANEAYSHPPTSMG